MSRLSFLTHSLLLLAATTAAAQAPSAPAAPDKNSSSPPRALRDGPAANPPAVQPEKIGFPLDAPKADAAPEAGAVPEAGGEFCPDEVEGFPEAAPPAYGHGTRHNFFSRKSAAEAEDGDFGPQKHGWFSKKKHLDPTDDPYEASTITEGLNAFSQLPSRGHCCCSWWRHH